MSTHPQCVGHLPDIYNGSATEGGPSYNQKCYEMPSNVAFSSLQFSAGC